MPFGAVAFQVVLVDYVHAQLETQRSSNTGQQPYNKFVAQTRALKAQDMQATLRQAAGGALGTTAGALGTTAGALQG